MSDVDIHTQNYINGIMEKITGLRDILDAPVRMFPDYGELIKKGTQYTMSVFMRDRAILCNVIKDLFFLKAELRMLVADYQLRNKRRTKSTGIFTKYVSSIQELMSIVFEKRDYLDKAVDALRSIQSANAKMAEQVPYGFTEANNETMDSFIQDEEGEKKDTPDEPEVNILPDEGQNFIDGNIGDML